MARLYVIIGPSGSGKTTLMRQLVEKYPDQFQGVRKLSDRQVRPDDYDILHVDHIDLRGNDRYLAYITNGGKTYFIDITNLKEKLAQGKSQIIIVNKHTTITALRRLISELVVVFIHRSMTAENLELILVQRGLIGDGLRDALLGRLVARIGMYEALAGGVLNTDHVILNTSVDEMLVQFLTLHAKNQPSSVDRWPLLNIIMAGTGRSKDRVVRMIETLPNCSRYIIPKYLTRPRQDEDGAESINVDRIPDGCLMYSLFGKEFGVDPQMMVSRLRSNGLGFVTVAELNTARRLIGVVQQNGMRARLVYLHQPELEVFQYDGEERQLRLQHARELLRLYQSELVGKPGLPVILAESDDLLCSFVQRMLLEVPA